jgi:hypothetical protein
MVKLTHQLETLTTGMNKLKKTNKALMAKVNKTITKKPTKTKTIQVEVDSDGNTVEDGEESE